MTGPGPGPALDRLWAGWRQEYVEKAEADEGCVLCRIVVSPLPADQTYVLHRDDHCLAVLNVYPYTSGHLMVLPLRHVAEPDELDATEGAALWATVTDAIRALRAAYLPAGFNVGANLGKSAGAGVPGHLHLHCVPRWGGDTNFMTTVAESRVLPEALGVSFSRLRAAWPSQG